MLHFQYCIDVVNSDTCTPATEPSDPVGTTAVVDPVNN